MNNYSWLQQKLHQFALSTKFIKETTFEYENFFVSPDESIDNNVFIAGLARSGTTILLNALFKSNEFASLAYRDMPFVLSTNLWSRLSDGKQEIESIERAHKDGIKISLESPEAFEEVFWTTFDDQKIETEEKFKSYVQLIKHRYQKKRYLSKNNQNIKRLRLVSKIFPKSTILIPFRDPIQHAYSLLFQHKQFLKYSEQDQFISNYMNWIGHTEFGSNYHPIIANNINFQDHLSINHWIEQWYLIYRNCLDICIEKENIFLISYEILCNSDKIWSEILKKLDVPPNYNFEFKHSKKQVSEHVDETLSSNAYSLYTQLNTLSLK